jgi:predicted DsbA family dithiol-disulfide isomerase
MEQSSLVRLQQEFDIDVEWRGFELHPETPPGGVSIADLFRGRSIEKIRTRMARFGAEFGVEIVVPEHLSNTRRALAMAEYARDQGALDAFRNRATRGYWVEARDLEKDADLSVIASEAGLDARAALEASLSPEYLGRVSRTREEGMDRMVSGVPTLFLGGMPVVGCQRYETFAMIAERAVARAARSS